jgi:glycosyltransferase involved in cell wall biosynthesis
MPFAKDNLSTNAKGGTELMKYGLESRLPKTMLDKFQIFVSRVHEPLSDKHIRLLWLHDLPDDPETLHLANNGWEKFHKLIFTSNWQMRGYIEKYNIPWSRCLVLQNAIVPISFTTEDKKRDKIRLIYHTTPHRGLQILIPVFQKLYEEFKDTISLDVYSSFKVYGWDDRDGPYQELFNACENHPAINYHGAVSNEEVHKALKTSHIYAYPSIWQETSCISLVEAMSAGLSCVHPNYGALPETASNWTTMYPWHEDLHRHANIFYSVLHNNIHIIKNTSQNEYWQRVMVQKTYINMLYDWDIRVKQWEILLESMENEPTEFAKPKFIYRT